MPTPSLAVNLPWEQLRSQGAALSGLGGDPAAAAAGLGPAYQNAYGSALDLNASLFGGLQGGYDSLRSSVDQQYADISKGYADLYGSVLGQIAGTNSSNLQDINTSYNASAGRAEQDLVSRGLGNSTTRSSVQRGIELDRQRALTGSQNQFAQLGANYASNLGLAGLGARQQGVQTGAGLGQSQLGMLERVHVPYPDAGMYTDLARMYGGQVEGQRNREQAEQAQQQLTGFGWGQGGPGVSGGSRGFTPPRTPSAFDYSGDYSAPSSPASFFSGGGYGGGGAYVPAYTPPAALGFSGGNYDVGVLGGSLGYPEASWEGTGEGSYDLYSGGYGGSMDYGLDYSSYG